MDASQISKQVYAAWASYADDLECEMSIEELSSQLMFERASKGVTETQAESVAEEWSVVRQSDIVPSGFSATLFRSTDDPAEYTLAMRGSDQVSIRAVRTMRIFSSVRPGTRSWIW